LFRSDTLKVVRDWVMLFLAIAGGTLLARGTNTDAIDLATVSGVVGATVGAVARAAWRNREPG
jgi:ABC-type hemin transport system substrate-binding protein